MSEIIVKFALFWLYDESSGRVHRVGDAIGVPHIDLSSLHFSVEEVLVVPGGLLLVHQATGRRSMLLAICSVVELTHDLIKLVHLQSVFSTLSGNI